MSFKGNRYCPKCKSGNLKLIHVEEHDFECIAGNFPHEFDCQDCHTMFLVWEHEDLQVKS